MTIIREGSSPRDFEAAASLFKEYAASLDIDLCFQHFDAEVASLPGSYAAPGGALFVAWEGDAAVGCVAIRPFEWPYIAEMKRLYVRPTARGRSLGRRLSEAAIARATEIGYRSIRLDTLESMREALHLYGALGFVEIDAYCFNPVADVRYMELLVKRPGGGAPDD